MLHFSRFDGMPGASEGDLIEHLRRVYSVLNESLLDKIARGMVPSFTQLYIANEDGDGDGDLPDVSDTPPSAGGPGSPGSTASPPLTAERRRSPDAGLAEAVLFGHMAEVLCTHEGLAAVLVQNEGLLSFFQFMCSTFFAVTYAHACTSGVDRLSWKV